MDRSDSDPLEQALDKILAGYAAVEPPPGSVEVWMAPRAERVLNPRFLCLSAPAWAAVAAALLLLLSLGWYRARERARTQARLAAGEHTVLVPLPPAGAPPLTDREKRLIQLMHTNPAALATQRPDQPVGKKENP